MASCQHYNEMTLNEILFEDLLYSIKTDEHERDTVTTLDQAHSISVSGCKVLSWSLSSSNQGGAQFITLTI